MYVNSKSLTVNVSAEKLFNFVSTPENLPKWAVNYCHSIQKDGDIYRIQGPMGESYFDIKADAQSGVIDMYGGSSKNMLHPFPSRVVSLPDGSAHLTMTCVMMEDLSEDDIKKLEQSFAEEFDMLRQQVTA